MLSYTRDPMSYSPYRGSVDEQGLDTLTAKKKARTRTGCWNCRRRRKKCNDRRPVCGNCLQKGEVCEWGIRLSFRRENVHTIPQSHPSMRQDTASRGEGNVKIVDVTSEVIRDYQNETATEVVESSPDQRAITTEDESHGRNDRTEASPDGHHAEGMVLDTAPSFPSPLLLRPSLRDTAGSISTDLQGPQGPSGSPGFRGPSHDSPASVNTLQSYDMVQSAAVQLLDLTRMTVDPRPATTQDYLSSQLLLPSPPQVPVGVTVPAGLSPDQLFADDGIFLPGSAYLELHSALRHHIFDTARSTYPTRWPTPSPGSYHDDEAGEVSTQQTGDSVPNGGQGDQSTTQLSDTSTSPKSIELTKQEEYLLWKNWVDEIAPWLDKFDHACHFQQKLPALAKVHSHLRFSMLALSARQLERKDGRSSSASLALYQEAVHQLVPQLQTKSTEVVASCVVLCVLEMMSCSPQMWRRHLDGCACLIQSLGMNGFSEGMEQALFWCFARMDVCGGLISSESTLIPTASWTPRMSLADAAELFHRTSGFDMYANFIVFLCAHALGLFACDDDSDAEFTRRWNELFAHIESWYHHRPPEMRSILSQPAPNDHDSSSSSSASPFPTLLFSNAPAISGNQLYHTAALLMLQRRPRRAVLPPKTRPILWHARRICAISISNGHHGCWTNCVQPLWIAGQVMSHHAEHRAILETYARIEKETGWGTSWRAEDLKAHWAELDEG